MPWVQRQEGGVVRVIYLISFYIMAMNTARSGWGGCSFQQGTLRKLKVLLYPIHIRGVVVCPFKNREQKCKGSSVLFPIPKGSHPSQVPKLYLRKLYFAIGYCHVRLL